VCCAATIVRYSAEQPPAAIIYDMVMRISAFLWPGACVWAGLPASGQPVETIQNVLDAQARA
jgi:hypothetical protein